MHFYCYCVWYMDDCEMEDRRDRGFFAARSWQDAMGAVCSWYGEENIIDVRLLALYDDRCEVDDWPYATGSEIEDQVRAANADHDMCLNFMGEKPEVSD